MLAYRHAFHAGNHADVLKHVVLTQVLRHLNGKDKAYRLIDTHAGAGGYSLQGGPARKRGEYLNGIARLWDRTDLPPPLSDYVQLVHQFNSGGPLRQYPGSPAFAQMLLRAQDELHLYELHPTDHRILAAWLKDAKRTRVVHGDGYKALNGELPPPSRRGAVLMDPSYELPADYGRVAAALKDAVKRFADGTYLVWYPQLQRLESAQLPKRLKSAAPGGWLHVRLTVQQPDALGFGLAGSGMFVVNPPHTLHATLQSVMPAMTAALAQYDGAHFLLEQQLD